MSERVFFVEILLVIILFLVFKGVYLNFIVRYLKFLVLVLFDFLVEGWRRLLGNLF